MPSPYPNPHPTQRRERLTDLFLSWDVNGDGFVVLSELVKGLQARANPNPSP